MIGINEFDSQTKQGWWCLAVCLLIMYGILAFGLKVARTRIGIQDTLDQHGVTTTGRVEGKSIRGNRSNIYLMQYSFQLNGTPYKHDSQVSPTDYFKIQPGQVVTITYLPDRPGISRAQQSIARSEAEMLQNVSYLCMGLFALIVPVYGYSRRRQRQRLT